MRYFTIILMLGLFEAGYCSPEWPNEPAGSTLISDWGFDAINGSGWQGFGDISIVNDASAPRSPGNVLRYRYATGFVAGSAPGRMWHSLGGNQTEIYVGFWWKPSDPWQQEVNSGTSKIDFLLSNGPVDLFSGLSGPQGSPYRIVTGLEFPSISNGHLPGTRGDDPGHRTVLPNVTTTPIVLGKWYRIERYIKYSTTKTSRDGIYRLWVNGVLNVNYTTVNYDTDWPFVEYNFSPTWGGMNNTKTQTDFYWFDHVHLSLPRNAPPLAITSRPLAISGSQVTFQTEPGRVSFQTPWSGQYAVSIFDPSGRKVWRHSGNGEAVWNHGGKLPRGAYFVQAEQNGKTIHTNYHRLR